MNAEEFYTQITSLSETFENRDLKEYLLALLKIVEENRSKTLTYELVMDMIKNTFISEPLEEEWLKYDTVPDETPIDKNGKPLHYISEFYTGSFVSDYCAKDIYVFYNPEDKTIVQVYQIT